MKRSGKPFQSIGTRMRGFGRSILRSYLPPQAANNPEQPPAPPPAWVGDTQVPLNWPEDAAPPTAEAPFEEPALSADEYLQQMSSDAAPPARHPAQQQPVRRAPAQNAPRPAAPNQPIQRQPAPPPPKPKAGDSKADARLLAILAAHQAQDAERERIREQRRKELGSDVQRTPGENPTGRRRRASFDYVETSTLKSLDKGEISQPTPGAPSSLSGDDDEDSSPAGAIQRTAAEPTETGSTETTSAGDDMPDVAAAIAAAESPSGYAAPGADTPIIQRSVEESAGWQTAPVPTDDTAAISDESDDLPVTDAPQPPSTRVENLPSAQRGPANPTVPGSEVVQRSADDKAEDDEEVWADGPFDVSDVDDSFEFSPTDSPIGEHDAPPGANPPATSALTRSLSAQRMPGEIPSGPESPRETAASDAGVPQDEPQPFRSDVHASIAQRTPAVDAVHWNDASTDVETGEYAPYMGTPAGQENQVDESAPAADEAAPERPPRAGNVPPVQRTPAANSPQDVVDDAWSETPSDTAAWNDNARYADYRDAWQAAPVDEADTTDDSAPASEGSVLPVDSAPGHPPRPDSGRRDASQGERGNSPPVQRAPADAWIDAPAADSYAAETGWEDSGYSEVETPAWESAAASETYPIDETAAYTGEDIAPPVESALERPTRAGNAPVQRTPADAWSEASAADSYAAETGWQSQTAYEPDDVSDEGYAAADAPGHPPRPDSGSGDASQGVRGNLPPVQRMPAADSYAAETGWQSQTAHEPEDVSDEGYAAADAPGHPPRPDSGSEDASQGVRGNLPPVQRMPAADSYAADTPGWQSQAAHEPEDVSGEGYAAADAPGHPPRPDSGRGGASQGVRGNPPPVQRMPAADSYTADTPGWQSQPTYEPEDVSGEGYAAADVPGHPPRPDSGRGGASQGVRGNPPPVQRMPAADSYTAETGWQSQTAHEPEDVSGEGYAADAPGHPPRPDSGSEDASQGVRGNPSADDSAGLDLYEALMVAGAWAAERHQPAPASYGTDAPDTGAVSQADTTPVQRTPSHTWDAPSPDANLTNGEAYQLEQPAPEAEPPMDVFQALMAAGALPEEPAAPVTHTGNNAPVQRTPADEYSRPPEEYSASEDTGSPAQSVDLYQALQAIGAVPKQGQPSGSPPPGNAIQRSTSDAERAELERLLDLKPPPAASRPAAQPVIQPSALPGPAVQRETSDTANEEDGGVDLDKLARDVYSVLRDRLRIERERRSKH